MNDTAAIIAILILLSVGQVGILIRLRQMEKSIQHLPHIIRIHADGRERYVELLEAKLRDSKVEIKT